MILVCCAQHGDILHNWTLRDVLSIRQKYNSTFNRLCLPPVPCRSCGRGGRDSAIMLYTPILHKSAAKLPDCSGRDKRFFFNESLTRSCLHTLAFLSAFRWPSDRERILKCLKRPCSLTKCSAYQFFLGHACLSVPDLFIRHVYCLVSDRFDRRSRAEL